MNLKKMAAAEAVKMVERGMVLGLGTGSTSRYAIEMIAKRLRGGGLCDIVCVPTSSGSEKLARDLSIPLTTLREHPMLDLTIDGADEVDSDLNLIKGGGGALLHERIVAQASQKEVIIVDESKLVSELGTLFPLPVEVVPFGRGTYAKALEHHGCEPVLRMRGEHPYLTDEGNHILDCRFPGIPDPAELLCKLRAIPGVVDVGIFVGLTSLVIVASESGVRQLRPFR